VCFGIHNKEATVPTTNEPSRPGGTSDPRIGPLEPPYRDGIGQQLERMMPPGVPPIALFRTFVKNLPMAEAMGSWGRYQLGRRLSLSMRDRELVIDRTCARCHCQYEWGVHVAFFADRVGLSPAQLTSLTHGAPDDPCWDDARERAIIRAVDRLHDSSNVDDQTWSALEQYLTEGQRLDLLLLCGWYHAISFAANGAGVPLEPGAPRFADVAPTR
jgi:alkylhydroperoxidase family enzyme